LLWLLFEMGFLELFASVGLKGSFSASQELQLQAWAAGAQTQVVPY
jgi:hypothetical protein